MTDAAARAAAARVELDRLLETDAPALRATLPLRFADTCQRFVALLLEANEQLNLTRVVAPAAVARLHLLDSLAALPIIDPGGPRRGLDLGSGGGLPGLVLALARPDMAWTLVDSAQKKADALGGIVADVPLDNVEVVAERAELLGRDAAHRGCHDLVTVRACASLPVLAEYALPLLRSGGMLLAWKGAISDAELRAGAAAAVELGGGEPDVRPTGLAALGEHRFVIIVKMRGTPDRYPRRPGVPVKRPLGG